MEKRLIDFVYIQIFSAQCYFRHIKLNNYWNPEFWKKTNWDFYFLCLYTQSVYDESGLFQYLLSPPQMLYIQNSLNQTGWTEGIKHSWQQNDADLSLRHFIWWPKWWWFFTFSGFHALCRLPCCAARSWCGIYNQIRYSFVQTPPSISTSQWLSVYVCVNNASQSVWWSYDNASDQHKGTCAEIQLLYCLQRHGALFSTAHFKAMEFQSCRHSRVDNKFT